MSWKDRYKAAEFRGVKFFVDSHAYAGGRRVQVHEFPGSENPFAEDLGRKAREFVVEAIVVGPDYDAQRDALRDALEQPGPGTLVHPYLGTMTVQVGAVSMRETTIEGGAARFSITFEEGSAVSAAVSPDTAGLAKAAAGLSIADACSFFRKVANYAGLPAAYIGELEQDLGNLLAAAESVVKGVTDTAKAALLLPSNLTAALAGALAQIESLAASPSRAFSIYMALSAASSSRPVPPANTLDRQTQAAARAAMTSLVQQLAVAQAAILIANTPFSSAAPAPASAASPIVWSANQALAMRDAVTDALDEQMLTAPDPVYDDFRALRAAVCADVAARGANLAQAVSYTPPATLPALVIAQLLYGDATRADDVIARNAIAIRHPGFVAGGHALEVLSDS